MFEVIGFIVLGILNAIFSALCIGNIRFGGGDLGNLFTGWVNWKVKLLGVLMVLLNLYFWHLLIDLSPFQITYK